MKLKIIGCVCLSVLLLFGVISAQKNDSNKKTAEIEDNESDELPSVCKYLMPTDAAKILGLSLRDVNNGLLTLDYDKYPYCQYGSYSSRRPGVPFVGLNIVTYTTKKLAQSFNNQKLKALTGYEQTMLDKPEAGFPKILNLKGLGEKAKLIRRNRLFVSLYFQKGSTAFELTLYDDSRISSITNLKLFAKKVFKHFRPDSELK